jgi:hypothetical protein
MNNKIRDLRLMNADLLEALAATDRRVGILILSTNAMLLALNDVSPAKFERAYAKHFEELKQQGVGQSPADTGEVLLAMAKVLRGQS